MSIPTIISLGGRNEAGLNNETRDCAVRAHALLRREILHGLSFSSPDEAECYARAHAAWRTIAGRRDRGCAHDYTDHLLATARRCGFALEELAEARGPRATVGRFLKNHPQFTGILRVRRHVFAVLRGIVHDYKSNSGRAVVRNAYWLMPLTDQPPKSLP